MKNTAISIFLLIFSFSLTNAQIEATTNGGKKVLLHDDGTWSFVLNEDANAGQGLEDFDIDCDDYVLVEEDKVTGTSSLAAKDLLYISQDGNKSGLRFYLLSLEKGEIVFNIKAVGAGNCIEDDNKMNILFRDGSRLELVNDGKFNCDAEYTQYFGGLFRKNKELEMLREKEIETVRVWTYDSFVEEDFTPTQSRQLIYTLNCLLRS